MADHDPRTTPDPDEVARENSLSTDPDDVVTHADWPFAVSPEQRARVRKRRYFMYFVLFSVLLSIGSVQIYHSNERGLIRLQRLYNRSVPLRLTEPLPISERELAEDLGVTLEELFLVEEVLERYQRALEERTVGPLDWAMRVSLGPYTGVFSYRIFLNAAISALMAVALFIRARDRAASEVIDRQNQRLRELNQELERRVSQAQQYLEELRQAQSKLLQAQKLATVGRMSATLAHEIRNPMSIIQSAAGMAADDLPPGSPPRQAIELIRQEVARLNNIITELLDFARPKPPNINEHDAKALLQSWAHPIAEELEKDGIRLELRVPEEELHVLADADQLYQVLLNLVWNARDAMKDNNGGVLEIQAEEGPGDGEVRISVTDDGPGIDREALEQVAEPFFTTKTHGSGLGLPVVHQLVEGMGGATRIESDEGQGVRVDLTLRSSKNRPPEAYAEPHFESARDLADLRRKLARTQDTGKEGTTGT